MADVQLSTLGSVIKTAYEGEANTNAFTDAEQTKLAALNPGAYDLNGADLTLDADADTTIDSTVDDEVVVTVGGVEVLKILLSTGHGQLQIISPDSGSNAGPFVELIRRGGSQADSDNLGELRFIGQDDAGTPADNTYAVIRARARDSGAGSEDGAIDLRVSKAATMTTIMSIIETGVDLQGLSLSGHIGRVVTGVSGVLTAATHSGNTLVTSGNVEVPQTEGFCALIVFGGAHTITFNSTVTAAFASGDMVSVFVQSSSVIRAALVAAADQVVFT